MQSSWSHTCGCENMYSTVHAGKSTEAVRHEREIQMQWGKTGFCRFCTNNSSETLISWKSGKNTYIPLWDRMEGAWLWTLEDKVRKETTGWRVSSLLMPLHKHKKKFEECVREETAYLATLKSSSIWVDNLLKETSKIETGMAEKSSWDQANRRQKLGLFWRNRKKISQIIKDYFYLPFVLLIILWSRWILTDSLILIILVTFWDE